MTILVERDGIETDKQSKQKTYKFTQHGSPIIKINSNVPDYLGNCAVIENLIIDGENAAGTIGILLDDVYNCYIRNITIKNCTTGIQVRNAHANGSRANRFEHIYMINVKTGIDFTNIIGNTNDYSYTVIDHVNIRLKNQQDPDATGIKVGSNAKLNNTFIKANVWLGDSGGKGLVVDGQLKYSLVNFRVENFAVGMSGTGMRIGSGAVVDDNQSFLLTAINIGNKLDKSGSNNPDDVVMRPP